ncbi:hypothetical protein ATCC90586_008752 [Pythium insidiosum]|nr:hypothetical protein ATCC90586_008752 [Pythium insidiosum]
MVLPQLPHKLLTLAFVVRRPSALQAAATASASASPSLDVLLGLKKRGFGQGKWNGFGGKVDPTDASVVAAAAREVREEANIDVKESDLEERGIIMFTFEGGKEILEVHVFMTDKFAGEPSESDEMLPKWYDEASLPFDDMWSDDRIWLPQVLAGKAVYGHFHFDSDEDTLVHHELDIMEPSTKLSTLVFVTRSDSHVLLGYKKRGFGHGKWNGFGGKLERSDASVVTAAKREMRDHAVQSRSMAEAHAFVTDVFDGEQAESEEMRPPWFALDASDTSKHVLSTKHIPIH